jgi:hypothetical protein
LIDVLLKNATIEFKADKTVVITDGDERETGLWLQSGDRYVISIPDAEDLPITVANNKLIIIGNLLEDEEIKGYFENFGKLELTLTFTK